MPEGNLDRWARFMAAMARPGGRAILIHKAEALPELIATFTGRFGDLLLLPIHPRSGAPASRVILRGIKSSRAPLQVRPGLVLHDPSGRFMPEVEAILRHGAALDLDR
jgi:tRNA1(Val) A37 N6-methylase TrmN6